MFSKIWSNATNKNEVFFLSVLVAAHQVNIIRILDFLRYIQNIAEALVIPIVCMSVGLLVKTRIGLKHITLMILLSLLFLIGAIWVGSYWITIALLGFFFLLCGQALRALSSQLNSVEFYAKELLGWIVGSLVAYLSLPFLGAEKIYFITILGFLIFYLWIIGCRTLLSFISPLVGGLALLFFWGDYFNLYRVVSFIPSKRDYLNESRYNGTFSIHSLGAKVLDTVWTPYDRIDILQFPNGERSIFFSNQSWSRLPPAETEAKVDGLKELVGKKALILGLGGGIEFSFLERAGFQGITGVELYSELIQLMSEKYSPKLFSRNYVVSGDMRHYLRNTSLKFDFILHSSPDLATKIGFSGWPIINESTTYEALQDAFGRVKQNGLFAVRAYYKSGNDFSIGIFQALRNISPEHRVQIYFLDQEHFDTPKTFLLFVIKKGEWSAEDHKLIQAIYPESKRLRDNSLLDQGFFDGIQKALSLDVSDLSIVGRDSLLEKIEFDFGFLVTALVIVFFSFALFSLISNRAVGESGLSGLVFFSGIYWALLEFSLITFFSNAYSDSILAFLMVFQGLMIASWISNAFLPKNFRFGAVLLAITPLIALGLYYFVLKSISAGSYQASAWLVLMFACLLGFIASFNFNFALRQRENITSLLAWNLLGFTIGAIISWFLIKNGKPDLFINLLVGSSIYGALFCGLRWNRI